MIIKSQISDTLKKVTRWADNHDAIIGLALVGSHANGKARNDSDVDLVVVASDPAEKLLRDRNWIQEFGNIIDEEKIEDWGLLTSVRVQYENNVEIEFGITSSEWTMIPTDPGTSRVVTDGIVVLYDPEDKISKLVQHCQNQKRNT